MSKTSFMISEANFILTFNISILQSPSNVELWSWYTMLKALSWMRFMWLFNFWFWNIQITGSLRELRCYESIKKNFFYSNFKEYTILAKAFTFWLAFSGWPFYMGFKYQLVIFRVLTDSVHFRILKDRVLFRVLIDRVPSRVLIDRLLLRALSYRIIFKVLSYRVLLSVLSTWVLSRGLSPRFQICLIKV